jgi:hypothetical protein
MLLIVGLLCGCCCLVPQGDNGVGPGSAEAWRGTSLAPAIESFTAHFLQPLLADCQAAAAEASRVQQQAQQQMLGTGPAMSAVSVDMSW